MPELAVREEEKKVKPSCAVAPTMKSPKPSATVKPFIKTEGLVDPPSTTSPTSPTAVSPSKLGSNVSADKQVNYCPVQRLETISPVWQSNESCKEGSELIIERERERGLTILPGHLGPLLSILRRKLST